MKNRLMAGVLVLVLSLALGGGALAASFPDRTIGLTWIYPDSYMVLTCKLNGNVKMAAPVKFYTLSGALFGPGYPGGHPVTGGAYVWGTTGSQRCDFHLTGTLNGTYMDVEGTIREQNTEVGLILRNSNNADWGYAGLYKVNVLTADQIKALLYPK